MKPVASLRYIAWVRSNSSKIKPKIDKNKTKHEQNQILLDAFQRCFLKIVIILSDVGSLI